MPFSNVLKGFDSRAMEEDFRRSEHRERKAFQEFALWSGLLIYALFGLLDLMVGHEDVAMLLTIRGVLTLPIMLALTIVFRRTEYHGTASMVMSLYLLAAGGSIAMMIALASGPAQFTYPIGVLVVICFGAGFCGHDFRHSLFVNCGLISVTVAALLTTNAYSWVLASSVAFLLAALLIMAVASYTNETVARSRFMALQEVRASRERALSLYGEAQRSRHALGQFLATVSHELRTPLNAIIGFSDAMSLQIFGPLGDCRYKEYARDIGFSGKHLAEIIEDIIDISRAEVGELTIASNEFDIVASLGQALKMCRGSIERRCHRIETRFDLPSGLQVQGDETRIKQAIVNLIGNAAKFTPPGGLIAVTAERGASGAVNIAVKDNGPGIAQEDLIDIREPFRRLSDAYLGEAQGLGLGLSIVDQIMAAHGGELRLESAPGEGCRATLVIPATRIADTPESEIRFAS